MINFVINSFPKKKLLDFRGKKLRHNLAGLSNAHNVLHAMLTKAESDMTSQHLPFCCLRGATYRTASSPLSHKNLLFFQAVPRHFFKKDY
jgi:hypothetical protein